MFHLRNHTASLGSIWQYYHFVNFGESHPTQHQTMLLRTTNHAAYQPYSNSLLLVTLRL